MDDAAGASGETIKKLLGCMRYDKMLGDAFANLFPSSEPQAGDYLDPTEYATDFAKWTLWTELEAYYPIYFNLIA